MRERTSFWAMSSLSKARLLCPVLLVISEGCCQGLTFRPHALRSTLTWTRAQADTMASMVVRDSIAGALLS